MKKVVSLLVIVFLCLLEYVLHRYSGVSREYEIALLLQAQSMLLGGLAVWCGTFIFLTFRQKDWLLIVLLLVAIISYFISQSAPPVTAANTLLFGVMLGKAAQFFLKIGNRKSEIRNFLTGLVMLLAFSAWWHLDMTDNSYNGPRWMGLWDNPNIYGMLMGAGLLLAMGMLAGRQNGEVRSQESEVRMKKIIAVILFIAAGMMGVGLVCSYSRGAWAGAVIGLLYLAKVYGKFKWRYLLPVLFITAAVICFCWNTPDSSPWYVKRLDLSRGSVTHRLAAWRGALQMMRDHPLGVGWNKAVEIYGKNYSPPEDGAGALNTNDYLMLGTQLGFPGLICFVAYVALCFRRNRPHLTLTLSPPAGSGEGMKPSSLVTHHSSLQAACRAGALALLVTFWFDGGLFKLPTAAVFWILLELGSEAGAPRCANAASPV